MKFNLMRYGRGSQRIVAGKEPSIIHQPGSDIFTLTFMDAVKLSTVASHYVVMDADGLRHLETLIAEAKARKEIPDV